MSVSSLRLAALVTIAATLAACSDQTHQPYGAVAASTIAVAPQAQRVPLRVELIPGAVSALEAHLGGPQQYLEINATPTLVNLFVAVNDATEATAYVFAGGRLSEPSPPESVVAGAPTFAAAEIDFDESSVLNPVLVALPAATYRVFSVIGVVGGGVSYLVTMESAKGGQLQVPVRADGSIIEAVPN